MKSALLFNPHPQLDNAIRTFVFEKNLKQRLYCRCGDRAIMQKDELIQLHTFLFQVKTHVEDLCKNNGCDFNFYEKLGVTPYHVYKSKREHKLAVFSLSKGIAQMLSNNEIPGFVNLSNRLEQMSTRFMTEKEKELLQH